MTIKLFVPFWPFVVNPFLKFLTIENINCAKAATARFVLISRTNAALSGSNFTLSVMHGLSFFDFGMPGHYQMRPVGNKQPSSEIQHLKLVRLFHKSCGVENHSAADDALCSEPKNTGRDQVQLMNLESDTHCMPSVVSAQIGRASCRERV